LDFGSPEAIPTINGWVDDKTNGRIPKLLEEISDAEVLFLINAIYFKGKWRHPFDPKDTESGAFHAANGRDRAARLMRLEETLRYQENDDFQAVDQLYGNGAFSSSSARRRTRPRTCSSRSAGSAESREPLVDGWSG